MLCTKDQLTEAGRFCDAVKNVDEDPDKSILPVRLGRDAVAVPCAFGGF